MLVQLFGHSAAKVFPNQLASLVSGRKNKNASLLCSFRLIRLFFIIAVTTKSTQSFCFCCVVKCYFRFFVIVPLRWFQICSLGQSAAAKVKFHLFVFVSANTSLDFIVAVTTKSTLYFCICCHVKCYFSFLIIVPLGCFHICSQVLSVTVKVKFHLFVFVPADTGLFFIVAVKTKSTLSFCFCCLVKCYFSVVVSVPLRCFQISSLVQSAAGKVKLHLFCVCSGWYRFFLYSRCDNKKYAVFLFLF